MTTMRLRTPTQDEEIDHSRISGIAYTSAMPDFDNSAKTQTLKTEQYADLLQCIDFDSPRILSSDEKFAAVKNGQLVVSYCDDNGEQCSRTFNLLAEALLQDTVYENHYYDVADEFMEFLR